MNDLEYLKRKAPQYQLVCEFLDDDTLKVYSPKYFFDSWLIVRNEKQLELWHMSKRRSKSYTNKCDYHLQTVVRKKYKISLLKTIKRHNENVMYYSGYSNLVDKVLNRQR